MADKLDLKRELKTLYSAGQAPVLVEVPPLQYLAVDGAGDPNTSQDYRDATEALYGMAYTIKFAAKRGPAAIDYAVMPLEGLWWSPDLAEFSLERKDEWLWTSLILQPDVVTAELVDAARAELRRKKPVAAVHKVRLQTLHEGLSAQILHLGPYSTEAPTIETLHAFIAANGYLLRGKHHEIYLSDPRRGDPAKTRTIIRQPVGRA